MTAILGYGTKIKIGGKSTGTAIVNCRQIDAPKMSTAVIEAGAHDSGSGYVTKIAGMKDAGQLSFEILFNPNEDTHNETANGLYDLWVDKTVVLVAVEYPTTPVRGFEFNAFVIGYEISSPHDEKMTAKVTFEITGALDFYETV